MILSHPIILRIRIVIGESVDVVCNLFGNSEIANGAKSHLSTSTLVPWPHIYNFRWNRLIALRAQWLIRLAFEMEVSELRIWTFDFFSLCKLRFKTAHFLIKF
jgi:hypothetical protein